MAPSQLAQLKAALSTSGLSRSSQLKKSKTKGKAGLTSKDREKKQQKLDDIRAGLNKFDVREGKVKFDVGGKGNTKAVKGVSGRPAESRSKGLEQRKATLLPEHQLRKTAHTGAFLDRRFGESDPTITPEQRALERFTRQQEAERRSGSKKTRFNLNDDDDLGMGFGEEEHLGMTLTHGGRSIDDLKGDDFAAQGLGDDDDEELEDDFGLENTRRRAEPSGLIDRNTVKRSHFGGFEGDGDEEEPDRKKSKAEVMAEVIAKSKTHKYQRQQLKELDEELRHELDDDLDELRALLQPSAQDSSVFDPRKTGSNDVPLGIYRPASALKDASSTAAEGSSNPEAATEASKTAEEMDYDQYVRALAFEARAKPKDRTKTEEEVAKEEKEKLEAAERDRLRRMQGLGPEGSDEEDAGGKRRKGKGKGKEIKKKNGRKPEADDLSDDFVESGDEDEEDDGYGLGEGIGAAGVNLGEDSEEEDEEGSDDEEEDDDDDEEDLEDGTDDADGSDLEDLEESADGSEDDDAIDLSHLRKVKTARPQSTKKEVPFTFPCPTTHDDLLDIMDGLSETDVEIVTKRIRALYHPSLGEGNKERLQTFLGILLDHILYLASTSESFATISLLTPHVIGLVNLNPISAAAHFTTKLNLMQKNLARGLTRGAASPDSRTWPRAPELAFLRLVGLVWSTSDFSNPVAAPAELLIGQYLAQARVRRLDDVASGLFLCSLALQYESFSKRLVPEAMNFLATTLVLIAPSSCDFSTIPGVFPTTDPRSDSNRSLRLRPKLASTAVAHPRADLIALLSPSDGANEEAKVDLLGLAFKLCAAYAELYVGLEAFLEVFGPIEEVMKRVGQAKLPESLASVASSQTNIVSNLLKAASKSRRPLLMQAHKPVSIPTYTPKFDSSNPLRRNDPDSERAATAKLKALYKKERKGAIRELRKDNKFLAGEKAKERKEKDAEYEKRMRRVEGEIRTTERAEEKAAEREKAREKRRGGR